MHNSVRLDTLARLTTGMSGAELANLVNEAALCAARRNLDALTHECFEEALVRVQLGARRPLVMSEIDRRIIAFHESGHAVVAYYLPEADTVNRITILPHGQHPGATQLIAEEDRYNYTREALMARIAVALGGRVAVELAFGSEGVTTDAEDDLQAATALAWRMVTHWGMGKRVGVFFADYREVESVAVNNSANAPAGQHPYDKLGSYCRMPISTCSINRHSTCGGQDLRACGKVAAHQPAYALAASAVRYLNSTAMATMIDCEVQRILHDGRTTAYTVLSEHYDQLTKLAHALMEHEHLNHMQFEALLQE